MLLDFGDKLHAAKLRNYSPVTIQTLILISFHVLASNLSILEHLLSDPSSNHTMVDFIDVIGDHLENKMKTIHKYCD